MTFNRNKLRFALLMSWRETRAAAGKFAFLVVAIALGTGALTAVTGFNASVRHTLSREARSLMAADISVRLPLRPPQSDPRDAEGPGVRGHRDNARHGNGQHGVLGQAMFPFSYPSREQTSRAIPSTANLSWIPPDTQLDDKSVAVSDDLLLRLGINLGDSIRVGQIGVSRCGARRQRT